MSKDLFDLGGKADRVTGGSLRMERHARRGYERRDADDRPQV
jgi:hypothetical protein